MIFLLVSTLVNDKMEWMRDKLMMEGWMECYPSVHSFIQLQKLARDGKFKINKTLVLWASPPPKKMATV